ncbi:MAG: antibiotic biosynthesis monooxygenase [Kutzneria sp.]|nr:antibiotic biosynthesis monooxygenase [Kutzneria sp.]
MPALTVRFSLRDEDAATEFDALVADTVAKIRIEEPGTLVYAVSAVRDAPLSRVFYEVYESRAAFEAHERQDHVRRFLSERERHLTGVRVEFLDIPRGKGIPPAP